MIISNCDDVIDSRDIIERIEELESERGDLVADKANANNDEERTESQTAFADWVEDYQGELDTLKSLQDEAEPYAPDWNHGATLIRESYFTEYVKDLCEDIGSIPADCPDYIRDNIDWEGVADDLKIDYTEVDYDGVTYLVR